MVEDVEQHARVGEGQRPVRGRKGALVEQRDRLAAGKREVAQEAVREVGHLREVALPNRAERTDLRQVVDVETVDEVRGELRAGHGRRPREGVCEPQRSTPNDLVRDGGALRDAVLAHEQPVVPVVGDVE